MRALFAKIAAVCLLAASIFLVGPAARAQAPPGPPGPPPPPGPPGQPLNVPRTPAPIKIDGALDDAGWAGALRLDLPYEFRPAENVEAPVRTECYVAYDDKYLYVASRRSTPSLPASARTSRTATPCSATISSGFCPGHVRRRPARVRVPRQRAGRAGGRDPQRRGKRRGLRLGRHLELGRPDHGGRVRGRDGDPVHLAPLSAVLERPPLGPPRDEELPAHGAPPAVGDPDRPKPELLRLPKREDQRLRGDRAGPQPGPHPHGDREPDR